MAIESLMTTAIVLIGAAALLECAFLFAAMIEHLYDSYGD